MSNIYIQEPPTNGKVLLVTSVGDIDIELWAKETPKAARNFCQLCMEGYYNNTTFHRIVKGFIAQGGDPTGTGEGGESIYGEPFKDEIHQRLRFVRRGLVAMANAGKDDNGSQFFFTFEAAPELQGKHTIFGKVVGDTIYNMLKLEETATDGNDRPTYPIKIIKTKLLSNPFDDLVPREREKDVNEESVKKKRTKGTKNFSLLSFGEEAEDDEEQIGEVSKTMKSKSKSSHDLIDDPSLSSVPAVDVSKRTLESDEEDSQPEDDNLNERLSSIKMKLNKNKKAKTTFGASKIMDSDRARNKLDKREAIQKELKQLVKELKKPKNVPEKKEESNSDSESDGAEEEEEEMIKNYREQKKKFKSIKREQLKKGTDREKMTLKMLSKFQDKVFNIQKKEENDKSSDKDDKNEDNFNDDSWMKNELKFQEGGPVLAKDANVDFSDSYEIFDPRNPINQRRRGKKSSKLEK